MCKTFAWHIKTLRLQTSYFQVRIMVLLLILLLSYYYWLLRIFKRLFYQFIFSMFMHVYERSEYYTHHLSLQCLALVPRYSVHDSLCCWSTDRVQFHCRILFFFFKYSVNSGVTKWIHTFCHQNRLLARQYQRRRSWYVKQYGWVDTLLRGCTLAQT